MKKIYLLIVAVLFVLFCEAQEPFVFTMDTNIGIKNLHLNALYPQGYDFNYTIDLGDGTILNNVTENLQYTYSVDGVYTISITGDFPFFNMGDCSKVISIDQWGDIVWEDMSFAFADCNNMILNATDAPNLSQVTDLNSMFSLCDNFNQSINHWDVSTITNMRSMFSSCPLYNQPLDNWDVSNVNNMAWMFRGASAFNQSIDNWNVSNVNDMDSMFFYATAFNQPVNNWNVSNVTDMSGMFLASSFNQPLDNWDVSNVTDMSSMFLNATAFNQSINNWDTSNLEYVYGMFKGATMFNQPLDNWDTGNFQTIEEMFDGSTLFNQPLDSWDFTNVVYADNFVNNSGLDVFNYDSLLENLTNSTLQYIQFNVTGLEYCNGSARNYLINNLGWYITGDSVSPNCNFIFGSVYYDSDNDGCTLTDIQINDLFVEVNNGNYNTSVYINNSSYSLPVTGDNLTLILENIPSYFSASPQSTAVNFTTSNSEQVDFCLTANQTVEDLNISILPIDDARPGFETNYKLVIENMGTETMSNILASLTFDATKQTFVSATPSPTAITTNNLDFALGTINPFQTLEVALTMETLTPPTVNGDDILNFTASVLPNTNDYTPDDNTYLLDQIVVNAYDPNDKRVLQGEFITEDQTDNYLDYIIRFQNTGTANATFVRIEDELDADLDWNTLKITSASHSYNVEITNGNEVEFIFDNINLPYEAIDESGSNGFIAYKIKPKNTVQIGDIISGNAGIYFDYNLPIITNTVTTEVTDNLSINEYYTEKLVTVYPNPTKQGIHLKVNNGTSLESIKLYNIQGKLLFEQKVSTNYINTEKLSTGIYILSIKTNEGIVNKKVVLN
ncbi:BspA family leucine-rich repeat surface protein [Winogradskyella forsetii]|uniref:BspA family leucine-rich repeat surface protein n=1 Tax=Winogradskyella forsetii TaxID=2686077 RepID=UPI0015BF9486|nr:BspA family leucine-rich repeat surface protein [Winogradskyella forsetii]